MNDQFGSPTLASDICLALKKILNFLKKNNSNNYKNKIKGIYNLSSNGYTTWFKFALKIANDLGYNELNRINPISSEMYNALAKRPKNSKLNNTKFKSTFGFTLPDWEKSYKKFVMTQTYKFLK